MSIRGPWLRVLTGVDRADLTPLPGYLNESWIRSNTVTVFLKGLYRAPGSLRTWRALERKQEVNTEPKTSTTQVGVRPWGALGKHSVRSISQAASKVPNSMLGKHSFIPERWIREVLHNLPHLLFLLSQGISCLQIQLDLGSSWRPQSSCMNLKRSK